MDTLPQSGAHARPGADKAVHHLRKVLPLRVRDRGQHAPLRSLPTDGGLSCCGGTSNNLSLAETAAPSASRSTLAVIAFTSTLPCGHDATAIPRCR
ncbi:hypothetical protein PsYK624_111060 [Phanerochaete sordida]|uniref:Uncharacterized protein n=1 Tax=Phanerochaete sordida TaxID=48140 RepID=A0A9P3LH32_9APHY|nr:hypothetical protein PsYK624_111060 [Phanerochaete sordida]